MSSLIYLNPITEISSRQNLNRELLSCFALKKDLARFIIALSETGLPSI